MSPRRPVRLGGLTRRRAELLHDEIRRILGLVDALDLRGLEGQPGAVVHAAVHAPIVAAIQASIALLGDVLRRYQDASAPPAVESAAWGPGSRREFDFGVDEIVMQHPSPGRVSDLGFMARIELNQKLSRIETLGPAVDGWQQLTSYDSARRCVRKSLTAVGSVLCKCEGIATDLSFASELSSSLEIRRAFTRLRRSIRENEVPAPGEVRARLRGIGTQIAMFVGRPIYPDVRIDDRMQLCDLQARILDWLRDRSAEEHQAHRDGLRLWQDLAGFARVLALVNHRQELLEHDAHVVRIALGVLAQGSRTEVPERLLSHLERLLGLDDEVDALLAAHETSAAAWREPLSRIGARMSGGGGGEPSGTADVEWH